jgi:hypothetical protein
LVGPTGGKRKAFGGDPSFRFAAFGPLEQDENFFQAIKAGDGL